MANVLVIVGASIAAIKAPMVLRRLREAGHRTKVLATEKALHFITPLSLATAAEDTVYTDTTWFAAKPEAEHLALARFADVVVIASASADLIAKAALGFAEDLATATLLSVHSKVLWLPAMNPSMWKHPATVQHIATLKSYGHEFLGPVFGALGTQGENEGMGRMSEPEQVVDAVQALLTPKDLMGKTIIVSAGPTREYLDPVRFISNPSSGKMGYAVAQNALERGAEVILVSGQVSIPPPHGAKVRVVNTALEMQHAIEEHFEQADAVVMTAAIADYRAKEQHHEKQAKVAAHVILELVPNPDILASLGAKKGEKVLVGFAMETHAGIERAKGKAQRKNADFICLNYPTSRGTSFGSNDNQITIVDAEGNATELPRMSKHQVAREILDRVCLLLTPVRN